MGLLRLWLAFSVLRFHTTVLGRGWMPNGQAAVEAFFVMSGFAMAMVLEEKYGEDKRRFWIQRLIKLWPAYAVAVLLSLVYETWLWQNRHALAGVVGIFLGAPALSAWAYLVLGFSNLSLLGQDLVAMIAVDPVSGTLHCISNPFAHPYPGSHFLVLPQAWSLSIEFVFYALAPWYVRLSTRALCLIFLGGLLLRLGIVWAGLPPDPWAYRLAPVECSTFSLGILSWRFFRSGTFNKIRISSWLGSLGGWLLLFLAPSASQDPLLQSLSLVLACAVALPWIFGAAQSLGWDRILGEWAYPYYLLHILVSYLGMDVATALNVTPRFWILAPGCLLASALFWLAMRGPLRVLQRHLA